MKKSNIFVLIIILSVLFVVALNGCAALPNNPSFSHPRIPQYTSSSNIAGKYDMRENNLIYTSESSSESFYMDVNTANYQLFKNMILNDSTNYYLMPQNMAKLAQIDQMLNSFDYDYYTAPSEGELLNMNSYIFDCSYDKSKKILALGFCAEEKIIPDDTKNNIVILLDTSNSMNSDKKLELAKQSLLLMLENLNEDDILSLITYSDKENIVFNGLSAKDASISDYIKNLSANDKKGDSEKFEIAYKLAEKNFIEGANNRVLYLSDGDFNQDVDYVTQYRKQGIYLSCIGFGDRYNYSLQNMETLSKTGFGTWGYIHSLEDAQRLLVDDLNPDEANILMDQVKSFIEFNSDIVKSYRMLGYETSKFDESESDFPSVYDGYKISSGFKMTLCFELKFFENVDVDLNSQLAKVKIDYKYLGELSAIPSKYWEKSVYLSSYDDNMTNDEKFMSSVIEFCIIALGSRYDYNSNINHVIASLENLNLQDEKAEFLQVAKKYKSLFSDFID